MHAKSHQSCPPLCNCMDCSPPGSSVHGILQARILEWVDIFFSRGSSQPTQESNPGLSRLPASAARFFTTSANWEALPCVCLFLLWRKIFPEVLKGPPQLPLVRFVLCGCTQTSTWQKFTMIKNYYNVHLLGPG